MKTFDIGGGGGGCEYQGKGRRGYAVFQDSLVRLWGSELYHPSRKTQGKIVSDSGFRIHYKLRAYIPLTVSQNYGWFSGEEV